MSKCKTDYTINTMMFGTQTDKKLLAENQMFKPTSFSLYLLGIRKNTDVY